MRFSLRFNINVVLLALLLLGSSEVAFSQKANFGKQPKVKKNNGLKIKTYQSSPKHLSKDSDWKYERFELTGGVGPCLFLGDLGGQDSPAKPFIFDFEPLTTRYSLSAGARYYLLANHAVKAQLSYARVTGADSLTNYPNRRYRNLNFKSPIVELSAVYEFHLMKPKVLHLAGARTTKIFNGNRLGAYGFGGISAFYFNPKSKFDGQWYSLAPLNTEGQGLPGGPKDYKRVSFAVPIGAGVYWLLNHNYKLGFEAGVRLAFTDYIDDASGYFYDNDAINENYGKVAAYFANPSVSLDDVPNPDWYNQNQPRGGSGSNDTYTFVQVTLSKSFGPSISNKPIKQSKGKKTRNGDKKKFTPLKAIKGEKKGKTYNSKKVKNKKRKFKSPKMNFGKKKKKKKGNVSF